MVSPARPAGTTGPAAPTPRQQQVLDFIRGHTAARGYPPAVRDIMRALGVVSPNGVACHLLALRKKGLLAPPDGRARSLVLPGGRGLVLPVRGVVAAGAAVEALEQDEHVDLRALFGDAAGLFLYRVPGADLLPARVAAGDLLVLRAPDRADAGRTVAAVAGGRLGLFDYFPLPKQPGRVRLAPRHGGPPLVAGPDAPGVTVLGVLAGVIRKS